MEEDVDSKSLRTVLSRFKWDIWYAFEIVDMASGSIPRLDDEKKNAVFREAFRKIIESDDTLSRELKEFFKSPPVTTKKNMETLEKMREHVKKLNFG